MRVIFYGKKFAGYEMEVFPYSTISSVEISKGFFTGYKITIFASGNKATMKWIAKGEPEQFVKEVRKRIGKKEVVGSSNDIYAQIEKLAVLKEKKVITASEFEDKKTQLLKRI